MQNQITTQEERLRLLEKKQQKDLVTYNPIKCSELSFKIRTVKDAIQLPSKSLSEFVREYGRDWAIGYVSMWVIELNDDANVKTKMTDAQMEFTATRIVDEYRLKVTDLTLFFRNVKEGKYGEYYENLSREKIMGWLGQYFDERCEYAQMLSQSNHDKFSLSKDKVHPDVLKKFAEIRTEIEQAPKVEREVEKNGVGKRMRKKVMRDGDNELYELRKRLELEPDDKLKKYLIDFDIESDGFDELTYEIVTSILDKRNNKN
jgi:hypothetical protein